MDPAKTLSTESHKGNREGTPNRMRALAHRARRAFGPLGTFVFAKSYLF